MTCWFPCCFAHTWIRQIPRQNTQSNMQGQRTSTKGNRNICLLQFIKIYSNFGDSVKTQGWIRHNKLCVHCPFLPRIYSVFFELILWIQPSATTILVWSSREERFYWLCHLSTGCEGSLCDRLSVEGSDTSTWKDSMYKAAGAEGESWTAAWGYKLLFYILLSFPHPMSFLSESLTPLP